MTDKQWDNIIALHNTAPFKLVREVAPFFRVTDGEQRAIVNISSTSGVHGNAGQANYGLAKSGINGLTKVIAKECVFSEFSSSPQPLSDIFLEMVILTPRSSTDGAQNSASDVTL